MMKAFVKLKIKHGSENHLITNLYLQSSIKDLIDEIRKCISLDDGKIELLTGFPPKPITTKLESTLSEANISSGDCIIVKFSVNPQIKRRKLDEITEFNLPEASVSCGANLENMLNNQIASSSNILMKITIPSDNSCLFASVFCSMNNGKLDGFIAENDRSMVAAFLISQPDKFNQAILDNKTPDEYSRWILNKDHWGGSIELALLSDIYQVEIGVVNTQWKRVDKFGENCNFTHRILILYDGVHYDSLARENVHTGDLTTKFLKADQSIISEALQLADELRNTRQYTDMTRFTIKCQDCGVVLSGQTEMIQHANSTKHSKFGEVH